MTLSNSRQQFLAYESQGPDDIQYGRKGGIFVSTCVCVGLVIFAMVLAALVGVIVYYITCLKVNCTIHFIRLSSIVKKMGHLLILDQSIVGIGKL